MECSSGYSGTVINGLSKIESEIKEIKKAKSKIIKKLNLPNPEMP